MATWCDSKAVARIPIIIGTIPFRNTFEQFIPSSRFQQNLRPSAGPAAPPTSTQDVGNDGLPSYGTLAIPLSLDGYPDLREYLFDSDSLFPTYYLVFSVIM